MLLLRLLKLKGILWGPVKHFDFFALLDSLERYTNCVWCAMFAFSQFLNDNFDYDELTALEQLSAYGLKSLMFDVAKVRILQHFLFFFPVHIICTPVVHTKSYQPIWEPQSFFDRQEALCLKPWPCLHRKESFTSHLNYRPSWLQEDSQISSVKVLMVRETSLLNTKSFTIYYALSNSFSLLLLTFWCFT